MVFLILKIIHLIQNMIQYIISTTLYMLDKNKSKRWLINELANIEKHIGGTPEILGGNYAIK